jgi:hypothetical protein
MDRIGLCDFVVSYALRIGETLEKWSKSTPDKDTMPGIAASQGKSCLATYARMHTLKSLASFQKKLRV